jgi:hypothetical protein
LIKEIIKKSIFCNLGVMIIFLQPSLSFNNFPYRIISFHLLSILLKESFKAADIKVSIFG